MSMSTSTVLVLGASYGGYRAAQILAMNLRPPWRVVVIERNTHANHIYSFPRFAVVPGHEHKVFLPYTNIFKGDDGKNINLSGHVLIHGYITQASEHSARFTRVSADAHTYTKQEEILFDYLVYALGSHLPAPINIWSKTVGHHPLKTFSPASPPLHLTTPRPSISLSVNQTHSGAIKIPTNPNSLPAPHTPTDPQPLDLTMLRISETSSKDTLKIEPLGYQRGTKIEGRQWLQAAQDRINAAQNVLVIGGGALGVQFAGDIAAYYPNKKVTLVHSGTQLLPRFDIWMHDQAINALTALGVNIILSSRVDLSSRVNGELHLQDGRAVSADLTLLCTGQKPNTSLLASIAPDSINPKNGMLSVLRSLQLGYYNGSRSDRVIEAHNECGVSNGAALENQVSEGKRDTSPHPHIFVVGDAADAFGALNAGHTAHEQGALAARNICKLISSEGKARLPLSDSGMASRDTSRIDDTIPISERSGLTLESYSPPLPGVIVTLGLDRKIYQIDGKHTFRGPGNIAVDHDTLEMWKMRGLSTEDTFL